MTTATARCAVVAGAHVGIATPKPKWKPQSKTKWEPPVMHGRTALSFAAERGDVESVLLLTSLG
jgi:hypothetical protein